MLYSVLPVCMCMLYASESAFIGIEHKKELTLTECFKSDRYFVEVKFSLLRCYSVLYLCKFLFYES